MFLIGEHVVCGSKGVCVIEQITRLNISGVDREREYYILKPLYLSGRRTEGFSAQGNEPGGSGGADCKNTGAFSSDDYQ